MGRMTGAEWIVVGVAVATLVLMFGSRLRPDLVALMAALALALLGAIPHGAVLEGLSSTVVVTLIGLFILAEGLDNTGMTRVLAGRLTELGGHRERRLQLSLMAVAAVLALGMSNVAVGALMLPSILRVARSSGVPVVRLLMPVSFATLLGGMATIFTSANIIVSDLLVAQGEEALGMADFARTGGLVAVAGFAYMLLLGRRWLPPGAAVDDDTDGDLFGLYRLEERFWEVAVAPDSALANRTVEAIGFGHEYGLSVLAIRRQKRTLLVPGPGLMIVPGDRVVVLGRRDRLRELVGEGVELKSGASPE